MQGTSFPTGQPSQWRARVDAERGRDLTDEVQRPADALGRLARTASVLQNESPIRS